MVYVDSNLVFEGRLPGKWLVDVNDPEYKGGIPGRNFGENDTPPDFGELILDTEHAFEGIIRYVEVTGRPTEAWIEQRRRTRLNLQRLLEKFPEAEGGEPGPGGGGGRPEAAEKEK